MIITRPKTVPGPISKPLVSKGTLIKRPLDLVKRTKIFLRAKLNGAPTNEARQLSGLSGNITQIMNAPITQIILKELCKEEEFQDKGIVARLKEMWHHKRTRFQKVGNDVEEIREDDTDMWKYSMDRVLELRGYVKNKQENEIATNIDASGGITFNVLSIPGEKKKDE